MSWDKYRTEPPGGSVVVNKRDIETRKGKKQQRFAMVPLEWGVAAAKVDGGGQRIVLILWLAHLAWKAKGEAFAVSNQELKRMGIDRRVKYRLLRNLEAAGLLEVLRQNKSAAVVRPTGCWENPWK
jgi:hypothetical protein